MIDNEITREKTFSEELPYFKERMKEVFDYYDNPKGCSEMLYISVLNDSNSLVRKAEEEITRQQAEIERLKENRDELWEIHCRDTERSFVRMNEIDALKEELKTAKSEAVKECLAKVKNYIKTHCNPYGKPDFDYDTSIKILNFIDNLAKEIIGE